MRGIVHSTLQNHHHKHYIDIKGVITSFSMTSSVGEVMAADITFEADGIPKETLY